MVENRAPFLRKGFTAPPALITAAAGAGGVAEFYNIVSALFYLLIIGTNGVRTKKYQLLQVEPFLHRFSNNYLIYLKISIRMVDGNTQKGDRRITDLILSRISSQVSYPMFPVPF